MRSRELDRRRLDLQRTLFSSLFLGFPGYGLRCHVGVQSVIVHNRATASAPSSAGGDAPERFWGQSEHQSNRFVSHVGVEVMLAK